MPEMFSLFLFAAWHNLYLAIFSILNNCEVAIVMLYTVNSDVKKMRRKPYLYFHCCNGRSWCGQYCTLCIRQVNQNACYEDELFSVGAATGAGWTAYSY